jgi:hypothetical protein
LKLINKTILIIRQGHFKIADQEMKMMHMRPTSSNIQTVMSGKQPKTQNGNGTSDGGYIWVG